MTDIRVEGGRLDVTHCQLDYTMTDHTAALIILLPLLIIAAFGGGGGGGGFDTESRELSISACGGASFRMPVVGTPGGAR